MNWAVAPSSRRYEGKDVFIHVLERDPFAFRWPSATGSAVAIVLLVGVGPRLYTVIVHNRFDGKLRVCNLAASRIWAESFGRCCPAWLEIAMLIAEEGSPQDWWKGFCSFVRQRASIACHCREQGKTERLGQSKLLAKKILRVSGFSYDTEVHVVLYLMLILSDSRFVRRFKTLEAMIC